MTNIHLIVQKQAFADDLGGTWHDPAASQGCGAGTKSGLRGRPEIQVDRNRPLRGKPALFQEGRAERHTMRPAPMTGFEILIPTGRWQWRD